MDDDSDVDEDDDEDDSDVGLESDDSDEEPEETPKKVLKCFLDSAQSSCLYENYGRW